MTIDEITASLKEWKGDNKDRHLLLLALDDERLTFGCLGNDTRLGYALALLMGMNEHEQINRIVKLAMFFNDEDNNEDNDEE